MRSASPVGLELLNATIAQRVTNAALVAALCERRIAYVYGLNQPGFGMGDAEGEALI